jgi:N-acetylneuraminic acid mutarotase
VEEEWKFPVYDRRWQTQELTSCCNQNFNRRENTMEHKKRHGHSSCFINNHLYIFGGLVTDSNDPTIETDSNECLIYNTTTHQWNKLLSKYHSHFHSAVNYQNRYMIVFGGRHNVNGFFNTTVVFDTLTEEWNIMNSIGEVPCARYGHKCIVLNDEMYLFGGIDNMGFDCNDLYALNLVNKKWKKIELIGNVPSGRYHFIMELIESKLIVFGGTSSKHKYLNDLYSINVDTRECKKIEVDINGRYGHVSYIDECNRLHIIGGSSNGTDLYNEVVLMIQDDSVTSLAESSFYFMNTSYPIFPRFCSLNVLDDGSLMLYGGFNANSLIANTISIYEIPDDICYIILSYLDRTSLCNISQVSKILRLSTLSSDNTLWEPIYNGITNSAFYKATENNNIVVPIVSYKQALMSKSQSQLKHRYIGKEKLQKMFNSWDKSQLHSLTPSCIKVVTVGEHSGKVCICTSSLSSLLINFI